MSEKKMLDISTQDFEMDPKKLGVYTDRFVENFYPSYGIVPSAAGKLSQEDSFDQLNSFTFYKICECNICGVENRMEYFSSKMQKLFSAAYAIKQEVCYGVVSNAGRTSLVIGVAPKSDDQVIPTIIEGYLPGVKLERYTEKFVNAQEDNIDKTRYLGCISGVPSLKIEGKVQEKDLSALMRSLNGQNYTIMILCKPLDEQSIQGKIDQAIKIQDQCYALSKRSIARQSGNSESTMHSDQKSEGSAKTSGSSNTFQTSAMIPGMLLGAQVGAVAGSALPIAGNIVGAVGGGLLGLIAGQHLSISRGKNKSKTTSQNIGYSDAVTKAINNSESISGDIQNGYAIELMNMAATMIERLKTGRSIGMWESVVTYSSDSKLARDIIQGGLYSEIASGTPDILPPVIFSDEDSRNSKDRSRRNQQLMIPKGFFDGPCDSPLCSLVTSEELCGICTIPTENTVGFEVNEAKSYAINYHLKKDDKVIGRICEYDRPISNMPFGLSEYDLNKHTFVCGITGSGKTNTVKKILESVDKPFLVIEPAKKEYRNINKDVTVYTMGRPEINCLKINPFYILPGVSPQHHIDLLKDLFSASFAFYGPMPYILEKCINNIYKKCGWNLTLGYHPKLVNKNGRQDLFDEEVLKEKYGLAAHKYLFPTMQDLKDEVDRYIEEEMPYQGEVKGNIRGAIKARIDSLCEGSKGYMFNTYNMVDIKTLLSKNTVLELEGLADDEDKAFALGILIIYINEYRGISAEIGYTKGLQHLLVIEEAHRLLKNVSTENNEDLGNPKGKAVEHFTNMLAEMRSYGQGVIVAEQIPSKLAPDVIKNSSNKIIHRLVAKDDKEQIASTIGVPQEDAIYLGMYKVGYALCHKEGMVQPVVVKIDEAGSKYVKDVKLYQQDLDNKMLQISQSMLQSRFSNEIDVWAFKTLVSLLYHPSEIQMDGGLNTAYEDILRKAALSAMTLVPGVDRKECVRNCIVEKMIRLMVFGVFQSSELPDDELADQMKKTVYLPDKNQLQRLEAQMTAFYKKQPRKKVVEVLAGLLESEYVQGKDLTKKVNALCLVKSTELCEEVTNYFRKGKF